MKRKKTPQEIFMEAILDPESEENSSDKGTENKEETTNDGSTTANSDAEEDTEKVSGEKVLDIDTLGLDDDEDQSNKEQKQEAEGEL